MPPEPSRSEPTPSASTRLDSWKQIASHLQREVRTAQRWEKSEGLPVHRHRHGNRDTVFAYAHELDAWLAARSASPAPAVPEESSPADEPVPPPRALVRVCVGIVFVLVFVTTLVREREEPLPSEVVAATEASPGVEAWNQGRYLAHKGTGEGLRASIEHFERALDLDPELAPARASLALSHASLGRYGDVRPHEAFPLARDEARRALELDPDSAAAHVALAMVRFYYDWNFSGASESFRAALESAPDLALGHHTYAHFLSCLGLHEEAVASVRRARELDPLWSRVVIDSAWLYYRARDFEGAIEESRRALELEPLHSSATHCLVESLAQLGEVEAAWSALGAYLEATEDLADVPGLAAASAAESLLRVREWRRSRLERSAQTQFVPAFSRVFSLAGLDRDDELLAELEAALEERDRVVLLTRVHPAFDGLRDDPRFVEILRRVGFPARPADLLTP